MVSACARLPAAPAPAMASWAATITSTTPTNCRLARNVGAIRCAARTVLAIPANAPGSARQRLSTGKLGLPATTRHRVERVGNPPRRSKLLLSQQCGGAQDADPPHRLEIPS